MTELFFALARAGVKAGRLFLRLAVFFLVLK